MLNRKLVLEKMIATADHNTAIVSYLGRASRDLYSITEDIRNRCFYFLGAMGSVVPFSLGLSLAKPAVKIWTIEGDGSILMNMGALTTVKKYGHGNLKLFIMDNQQYESTGGQPSHSNECKLEEVCKSMGLRTMVAGQMQDVELFLQQIEQYDVLVIHTEASEPSMRIADSPAVISKRFQRWIHEKA
jgi:sulfopyruvate decarboxylase subunit beta